MTLYVKKTKQKNKNKTKKQTQKSHQKLPFSTLFVYAGA